MKRVLLAPLDWGLGHATRCIPVVRELQRQGCEVVIAGSGDSLELMRREFPQLQCFSIPGYRPHYPGTGSMVGAMALQLPKFLSVVSAEHRECENLIDRIDADFLVSDNRYGCWSQKIPSVFITHQSNILMPRRFGWLAPVVRKLNERMINRFHSCWIPDAPGDQSLAEDLISFGKSNVKIKKEYIGWLSRFENPADTEEKYDVVAVFSGPEPQRTLLENTVVPQLKASALKYRVVRGLPVDNSRDEDDRIVNFLTSEELQACISASALVIARSGYSTVMDMNALGKKVVFIPTPGQTEQEYLAKRLMEKGIAFYMKQNEFNLRTALQEAKNFSGFTANPKNTLLGEAVKNLLSKINMQYI